jgi:8-oxo-dGTP diphosphatase
MVDKFNIRVYGIWIKDKKILLSNEDINGFKMVKLPGGGLEFGEGLVDGLKREFREELDVAIEVEKLIHTTDVFIQSAFRKNEQVIASHYLVHSDDEINTYEISQTTNLGADNHHSFQWVNWNENVLEKLTFEMDKRAISKLF